MTSPSPPNDRSLPENWHYESAVSEVNQIIQQIESGELDLADVFEQFNAAVTRLNQCEAFLNHQQSQMSLLIETLDETF